MAERARKPALHVPDARPASGGRFLVVVLLGCVIFGAGLGVVRAAGWMRNSLAGYSELQLPPDRLTVTPPPPWLAENVADVLLRNAGWRAEPLDLADPTLARRIAHRLEGSPWIAAVRVFKSYQRIAVDVKYREPVLCVAFGRQGCYVSDDGTVLPVAEAARAALDACLVLEGVEFDSIQAAAKRIDHPTVAQAILLARALAPVKQEFGLMALIAKPGVDQKSQFVLLTSANRRIPIGPLDANQRQLSTAQLHQLRETPSGPNQLDPSVRGLQSP